MARRLLGFRFWLLLPALLGACALPLNTAVRDWSGTAGIAVARPGVAEPEAARALRQALSIYFQALGVLWDGSDLTFDEARFAGLAEKVAEPRAAQAIAELGRALRAASDEKPPRWLPRDNSGPAPAYEDRRLTRTIRAADGPVRILLAALSGTVTMPARAPIPDAGVPDVGDPALRQALLERDAHLVAEGQAAGARYLAVLDRIAEGQAVLADRAGQIRQRSTELQLRDAEDRLQRTIDARRAPAP